MSLPFKEWVLASINSQGFCSRGDAAWPVRFVVFCWLIWKRRCSLLLDDRYVERWDFVTHGLCLATEFIGGMIFQPGLIYKKEKIIRLSGGF
ncbi:hypothetical protein V6N12_030534 [Hibiscus sabdariffa]|uniref:Reverse transcriptase zinc-binding domain-containing protein n=1 Tax=Hibiscus sabdariffa TaxID=183260 RepID=A0ABR2BBD7_9ROSI